MKRREEKRRGFTIIEVVLVLAVAGLIFMMVFVALPSLQRSQRDVQRKEDLQRLISSVIRYQGNNKGRTPWSKIAIARTDSSTYDKAMKATRSFVMNYVDTDATDYKARESDRWGGPMLGSGCTESFLSPLGNCYGIDVEPPFTEGYADDNRNLESISLNDGEISELMSEIFTVFPAGRCGSEEGIILNTKSANSVAIVIMQENGGGIMCADNS